MLYVIAGLSGSGKSTIANALSKKLKMKMMIQYTTRPMRPGEVNGIDYFFVSNEHFSQVDMLTKEEFKVAGGDTWCYGLPLVNENEDYVVVLPPKSIQILKDKNVKFVDILVQVNDEERIKRIFNRNDNQTLDEIVRREKEDKEIFKGYKPRLSIVNEGPIDDVVIKLINKLIYVFTY